MDSAADTREPVFVTGELEQSYKEDEKDTRAKKKCQQDQKRG